jgi:cell division protein FtsN
MHNDNVDQSEKRRFLVLSAALLVSAATITLVYQFQKNGTLSAKTPAPTAGNQSPVTDPNKLTGKDKERFRERYLSQAKEIRSEWERFAKANPNILEQMRRADPQNAPLVYRLQAEMDSLHMRSRTTGKGVQESSLNKTDAEFSWQLMDYDTVVTRKPEDKEALRHEQSAHARAISERFAKNRDFIISYSLSPGTWKLAIWASGRITEYENQYTVQGPGKPWQSVPTPHRELIPAFDFVPPIPKNVP